MSGLVHPHRPDDPLVEADQTWARAGHLVADVALDHPARWRWGIAFAIAFALLGVLVVTVSWLLIEGVGVWGNNIPVTWALDIVGYDWWIGTANGAIALSAMLLLARAEWHGAVNRIADTVALLGVAAAGLYPIIHLGRPWFFYWNLPYINTFLLWPQFRSPLYWDAVDIISFLGVAFLFWFTGLIPDLASLRDRALERAVAGQGRRGSWTRWLKARLYGIPALGWRGSANHWQRWRHAVRALAVIAIALVFSLQTGAAVMFAGSVEPGWHDIILPFSHMVGALAGGVGTVAAILVLVRFVFPLRPLVTPRHFDLLGRMILLLSLLNLYCYAESFGTAWLAGSSFDTALLGRRLAGPHAWAAWAIVACLLVVPQLFWIGPLRRAGWALAAVGLVTSFGTWADHFMLIVVTLQHDFLPSSSHPYAISLVGVGTFLGTAGLFLFILLLALRYVPVLSMVGLRTMLPALPVNPPARRGRRRARV